MQLHYPFVLFLLISVYRCIQVEQVRRSHLLTLVFCQYLSWSKWTAFLVSTSNVTVLKNFYSLYIHVTRHRDGKTIRKNSSTSVKKLCSIVGCIETWSEQTRFYLEGIRRWPVINLVNLIHEYSYLISLEIVVGYR